MLAMDTTSSWVWQELQMTATWNCNFLHLFFLNEFTPEQYTLNLQTIER